jgi:nucleotide-binding universal stress UspA family protein
MRAADDRGMTNTPIVVGYDGSRDAGHALAWALGTAALTQAPLEVVVAAMPTEHLPAALAEHEVAFALRTSVAARDRVEQTPEVDATVVVEHGWALPVLMHAAEDADLLVVGSRGHNRLEKHWLGSVSQHLAGHARCPVAVVRPPRKLGAEEILVGVDGSPSSVRALEYAVSRAELTGESVLAVHAFPSLSHGAGGIGALAIDIDTTEVDEAERLAAELVAGAAVDHPDVAIRSTASMGRAAKVLARLSEDASLVVVGSRGRTPVQELLLGSVSQETLHRAVCPVVVVR